MPVTRTYRFHEIFGEEIKGINQRRRRFGRDEIALEIEPHANSRSDSDHSSRMGSPRSGTVREQHSTRTEGEPTLRPTANSHVVGLALSGGGVRSASFCLGALQALNQAGVLKNVDYLSTVSGGGYVGTSLSAAMTHSKGDFPFTSSLTQDEPYPVQHIRNHSNYLFPHGSINTFYNVAIYLRGLLANGLLILPWLLFAAAITIFFKPDSNSLHVSIRGSHLTEAFSADHFGATLIALYVFALLLLAWGLWRSLELSGWAAEIGSPWTLVCAIVLIVLLIIAFCELQPLVLDGVFKSANKEGGVLASFVGWLKGLAAVLAPFSAVVAFFSRYIGRLLKVGDEKPSFSATLMRVAGKAAIYVAGAAIPFLLWIAYLYLCFLGIRDIAVAQGSGYHAPQWLTEFALRAFHGLPWGELAPMAWLYLVLSAILFAASLMLSPNANSLHRLYRDRLSKAFLFNPTRIEGRRSDSGRSRQRISKLLSDPAADELLKYENFELAPIDRFKLSDISCADTPYHLVNTALNIQGSKYANRRGRNADFFLFSPKFIGSSATQYVCTKEFEDDVKELDLATAMAVSGAAASSNMGANSIKALTPTLAILNVRLGYWVANPRQLTRDRKPVSVFASVFDQFYFLQELLGLMRENSNTVYLTDGGHIENLGIYELLRRRCELIIAIDAEADPEMSFCSLVTLQRYARIDLGTIINLPWAEIRDGTRSASAEIAKSGGLPPHAAPHGPHCAVGDIQYPHGRSGILIYVKSSITGDENDYIVDYKRRFPTYPHETTADQLFSEEQFEVYRALGFHAVKELFSGNDHVGMRPEPAQWQGAALNDPLVKAAKDLLKW
jgi:predicted acylesterase/phospholipase RssA